MDSPSQVSSKQSPCYSQILDLNIQSRISSLIAKLHMLVSKIANRPKQPLQSKRFIHLFENAISSKSVLAGDKQAKEVQNLSHLICLVPVGMRIECCINMEFEIDSSESTSAEYLCKSDCIMNTAAI